MKLSIIIPVNRKKRHTLLEEFISLYHPEVEVILLIDNYRVTKFDIFESLERRFNSNLRLIFNTAAQGYTANIRYAINHARGEHIWIATQDSSFNMNDFNDLIRDIELVDVDILEFKLQLKGEITWEASQRMTKEKKLFCSDNPEFIAYAFPMLQNKIFKKTLLKKSTRYLGLKNVNSIFSIEILYLALAKAKSYRYLHRTYYYQRITNDEILTPNNFIKEWKNIIQYLNEHKFSYNEEITYAKFFFFFVFYPAVLGKLRRSYAFRKIDSFRKTTNQNSNLIARLDRELVRARDSDEFKIFTNKSPYLIHYNNEARFILKRMSISKWESYFKGL